MKFTKKQRAQIEAALSELQRGIDYLMLDSTAVCRRGRKSTTLDYTRNAPPESLLTDSEKARGETALTEVAKDYGSPLCGVFAARKTLTTLLESCQ